MEPFSWAGKVPLFGYNEYFMLLVQGSTVGIIVTIEVVTTDDKCLHSIPLESQEGPSAKACWIFATLVCVQLLCEVS